MAAGLLRDIARGGGLDAKNYLRRYGFQLTRLAVQGRTPRA